MQSGAMENVRDTWKTERRLIYIAFRERPEETAIRVRTPSGSTDQQRGVRREGKARSVMGGGWAANKAGSVS